ncbi:MAG TPA: FkbM family methyltransferase [Planctomycetota bacterium]|nr:FkbM family methyltransferase [Planctomycetota bacterium]
MRTIEPPRGLMYRLRWSLLKRLGRRAITADLGAYRLNLEFSNVSARMMYYGTYESDEQHVILSRVREGMVALDVGANLGYFTLLMANLVGKSGRVYAFEPNPRMHATLSENIALNTELNDGRLQCASFALGGEAGRLQFFCPVAGHEGVGGLKNTQRAPLDRVVDVDVMTLDAFVEREKIARIDFIKLDIEGGELGFFKGATNTLRQMRPTILYEACDKNTSAYGYKATELHEFLKTLGYEISVAGSDENFLALPKEGQR